jgi:hypothetical protein
MKPSGKEHSCGLREDEALGAGDSVSGAFISNHATIIQQASLFVKKKMS